ncbi:6-hydroxymethylpterin diphosphokinase MptE-like protein [Bacillus sp. FJAT-22090]|uniref:6-hydroxymethylpterin diphosphokinase MptE-like protein n=1 Tax=Bacillus sp. FJAT-22090 TaxID=1581038 RepID=UPI0006B0173E|nr:6-hydroxymethylpterin diphosphokinase MptE-like protein [Bacillus sp. FJAT-22090]
MILPNVWLKAISEHHPYFQMLEDIKIRQMSYNTNAALLEHNFSKNIQNNNLYVDQLESIFEKKWACLIAGGPSLNNTVKWLEKAKDKLFLLSVGSSLRVLLANNIIPNAIIITDPLVNVVKQIEDSNFKGPLFYLSTANHEMTKIHEGKKIMLLQEGYFLAEKYALTKGSPLLETGGSVATTAISLIEYLGFEKLFLFGQDLGFKGNRTHSKESTSGIEVAESFNFRKVISNRGEIINTTPNLSTYHRWIERKARKTKMIILNTAEDGAKIDNVPMIKKDIFLEHLHSLSDCQFNKILENKLKN